MNDTCVGVQSQLRWVQNRAHKLENEQSTIYSVIYSKYNSVKAVAQW